MVTQERWKAAQQYEKGYWESVATDIVSGAAPKLEWYRWRADTLRKRLSDAGFPGIADGSARVVEIGGGPLGLVSFFPGQKRVAVDPLQAEYSANPVLAGTRDPGVEYVQGVGEALPCESGQYDLVVMENCIDHVRDVDAVMSEIKRVLRPGGVLYLTVNSRTRWGYVMHRVLSRLQIDKGHPHTFTPPRAVNLVRRHGFKPATVSVESAFAAHVEDLKAKGLRSKAKGLLGVSEFVVTLLAERPA